MSETNYGKTAPDGKYDVGPVTIQGTRLKHLLRSKYEFAQYPVITDVTADTTTLPDGSDGDIVLHQYPDGLQLLMANIGINTIDKPGANASGMNYGFTQTNNIGIEWFMGITGLKGVEGINKFTVGGPAFFGKLKFSIEDVSGADLAMFGFRKVEADQADYNDYDEMACLNVISGDINIDSIINAATNVKTDTTDNWADTETHTLEVYVSKLGLVTYKIDGVAPTAVNATAFSFDIGEIVTPFFHLLNDSDVVGYVVMQELEVGYQ
jgi:hypothetical protein